MNDAMVEAMFPTLVGLLANENIVAILTVEQKRNILEALNVSVEEVKENHIRLGMLFVTVDVDTTNSEDVKVSLSMDISKLT